MNTPDLIAKLKTKLKEPEMTQEKAARAIGVSVFTVNRWVRGKNEPASGIIRKQIEKFVS